MTDLLFQPYPLNDQITLNNRIVMAPLTRCMAGEGLVPTDEMAAYYARRADAGLIISEATIIRLTVRVTQARRVCFLLSKWQAGRK